MTNKIDLGSRNAVVTGGAQGIGRAIVERFLDSGAAVAIWDRDIDLAKKTAAELQKRGRIAPFAGLRHSHRHFVAAASMVGPRPIKMERYSNLPSVAIGVSASATWRPSS